MSPKSLQKWKSFSYIWLFEIPWTVHGTLQARILEWVAFPFSRRIFPTQGLNQGLPHCRWLLYQLSHKGCPGILEWVAYPFSAGSSWSRNRTGVSCIAGGFFTSWAISSYIIGSNTWFASFKVHHIQNILRELNMTSGPLLPISF